MKSLFREFARQLGNAFYMSVSEQMEADVGTSYVDTAPSRAKGLRLRSGRLLRSFLVGNPQGLFTASISENGIQVTVGSKLPYARIHDTGGVVRAKKVVTKRKRQYYAMALFFYKRYKETHSDYYRNLFLGVQKKGYVTIPQRNYFRRAIQDFRQRKFPRLLASFSQTLLREYVNQITLGRNET